MKRQFIIFIWAVVAAVSMQAQNGLAINSLFDGRYKHSPHATEIVVKGMKAARLGLDIYHSLSVTDMSQVLAIERLVVKDGATATKKEVEYRGGRLYYGYYVLARRHGRNRFLFYLNQSLARKSPINKVTLIYMEGDVSSSYIKKLIRQ